VLVWKAEAQQGLMEAERSWDVGRNVYSDGRSIYDVRVLMVLGVLMMLGAVAVGGILIVDCHPGVMCPIPRFHAALLAHDLIQEDPAYRHKQSCFRLCKA
jgi:hypothetical protein